MRRQWSVSDEVLAGFHGCVARERLPLLEFFNRFAEFPDQMQDYHECGLEGSLYSVAQFTTWIVTYWVGPAGSLSESSNWRLESVS